MQQPSDKVLIREPGNRTYSPPADIFESAQALWEYAVMSENAYLDVASSSEATPVDYSAVCTPDSTERIPLPQWKMWENFPSAELIKEANREGMVMEVWEKESSPPIIAVVFRGTEFTSWRDWESNLRWFRGLGRFIPFFEDQYTLVSKKVGREFIARLAQMGSNRKEVRIVATGHSLGGGLAQHFAYSLPPVEAGDGAPVHRVAKVYAFDPSPVTGWSSVDREVRTTNARGLETDRIFEHGEVLAYIRLLLGYVNPPSAVNPSIRQIRYNFSSSANIFKSHSMRLLACALVTANEEKPLAPLLERFRGRE